MFYSYWLMRDCISRMFSIEKSIDLEIKHHALLKDDELKAAEHESIKITLPRLNSIFMDFSTALCESSSFNNSSRGVVNILKRSVRTFLEDVNSYKYNLREIKGRISDIKSGMDGFDFNYEYNSDLPQNYRNAYEYKHLLINSKFISKILTRISVLHKRNLNALVPICCYDSYSNIRNDCNIPIAKTLRDISESVDDFSIKVFANPSAADYITDRTIYDKVAIGDSSIISNKSFDIIVMQPAIVTKVSTQEYGIVIKKELMSIRSYMKYVRVGGWMVINIPYYRINSLCSYLSKNLEDIHIFKDREDENNYFDNMGSVFIVGRKKSPLMSEIDETNYNLLRGIYTQESLDKDFTDINSDANKDWSMSLPLDEIPIKIFRTGILDEEQIKTEGVAHLAEFWDRQKSEQVVTDKKQPLLPFNVGQIGLVLTSGCLDGIVDEGGGACHLIKGRIVKNVEFNSVTHGDIVEDMNTESNHVEINIILPDGTVRTLA